MNYEIKVVESFKKELKKLAKRYKNIKNDYKELLKLLTNNNPQELGVHLGKNVYKLRLKNSDINKGKSAGYRVVYYIYEENHWLVLLSIYSKSDYESISEDEIDKKIMEVLNLYDYKSAI